MFKTLSMVLNMDPINRRALEKIWVCVELCKNYKASIKLHKALIDRQPYNFHAWYNLGHAYSCIGEYKLAIMSLEYSFLINEDFEIGYKDCAEMCYQVQRYNQALDVYLNALDQFGPDHELLVSIGQCYLELNNIPTARKYLKKASHLDPYDDETYYLLGKCATFTGDWRLAIKYYQKAIEIEDRREEYYAGMAEAYYKTGNHTNADYYYRKATETGPEQVDYWYEHLVFLIDLEAYDNAIQVLEEAEYHTYGTELLYCRAAIYLLKGRQAEGIACLTEGIEEDASKLNSFFNLYNYEKDPTVKSLISYYV
jgi:tetratricopeptide (TPR) repeat protein